MARFRDFAFSVPTFQKTASSGNLREQVEIIEYSHRNDLIIRLKSENPDNEIIIATARHGETLIETYDSVNWRIAFKKGGADFLVEYR